MMENSNDYLKGLHSQIEFCLESNRRATFKNWVFGNQANCSADKLAEAGFVFTGNKHEPDAVKCFLCNKSLDSWDEGDDPWYEHKKHSPSCSFVKMDKPECAFTLIEFIDIRNEFIENFVKNAMAERIERFNTDCDEIVQLINTLK